MASYVNNKELYQEIVEWNNDGCPLPIPDTIAIDISLIVKNYGRKGNFCGYTFIGDMIGEGIYQCIRNVHKFKYEKYNNPFAYFTMISHNAFLQIINKEKKLAKTRFEMTSREMKDAQKYDYNDIMKNNRDSNGNYIDMENGIVEISPENKEKERLAMIKQEEIEEARRIEEEVNSLKRIEEDLL